VLDARSPIYRLAPVLDLAPLAEQHVEVRVRAVGDEGLGAGDDDLVAVRPELGLHPGRVGARGRLGDRQRCERPFGEARQEALLLRFGAEVDQRLHRVEVGRPDDAGRRARFRDLAHAFEVGGIRQRRTAVFLRDEHRIQSQRVDRFDVLTRKVAGAVVFRGLRRDLLARKLAHAVDQHALLGGEADARVDAIEDVQCAIPWPPSM
jgi:hypothetical protein